MCSGLTAYAALKRLAGRAKRAPLLLVGLGGVGLMGPCAGPVQCMARRPSLPISTAKKRDAALAAGAAQAFDPSDPNARKTLLKASGGIYAACDFAGSDASLNFATAFWPRVEKSLSPG